MTDTEGYVDQAVAGVAEPQPMYKALRESNPVFRSPQAVVLSRLADIEMALKRTDLFSSNMDAVDLGNVRPLIPLQVDPPEHAKYRRILDPLFTPREMARREPQVTELVNEMIDRFADRGECDFHDEFAVPLPCTVFLQLLGLPLEDLDKFLVWKDGVIRPEGDSGFDRRARDLGARRATDLRVLRARHRRPHRQPARRRAVRDDRAEHRRASRCRARSSSTSASCSSSPGWTRSPTRWTASSCTWHATRSTDTSSSNSPTSCRAPSRSCCVGRHRCPASPASQCKTSRWADVPISKGERISPLLGAANTDPAEFADPDVVDFSRNPNRHRAFGGGPHRCLGSHLARMELRVALREFHRRITDYEIKPGTQLTYTAALRSVESLPLIFPVRMTRVAVDADRCTGHGRCYTLAPDVFDADEVGHCVVLVEDVSGELEAQAVTGEQNCPEQAITLSR